MTIYLQEVEEIEKSKTVIKKRVPSRGDNLGGMTLYTVHTLAGASLRDFDTIREARIFCNDVDLVMIIELLIVITKLTALYWNGTRNLKTDEYMHQVENEVERIRKEIYDT